MFCCIVVWFLPYTHFLIIDTTRGGKQKAKRSLLSMSMTGKCEILEGSCSSGFHNDYTNTQRVSIGLHNRVSELCLGLAWNFYTWSLFNPQTWNVSRAWWLICVKGCLYMHILWVAQFQVEVKDADGFTWKSHSRGENVGFPWVIR